MPFTVSHLAAVLPLRSGRTRVEALPTAPLVIGAMVPDLPAVLGAADLRPQTHTGAFALVIDLALTTVVWCAWVVAVRPAVVATFPEVAARWRPSRARRPAFAWWVVAAVVGTGTHLLWDAFTHSSEGATWFGGFAAHQRVFLALQLVSSVLGLLVLLVWARRWWSLTPVADPSASRMAWAPGQVGAGIVVVLGLVAGGLWRWLHPAAVTYGRASRSLMVGDVVFGTLAGALLAVAVLSAAFWVRRGVRRARSSGAPVPTGPASERVPG